MRVLAPAIAVIALAGAAPARDDHASALAALADVRASVREIVRIEDGYAVGHGAYLRAAHRAMNALVGRRDDGYAASFGDPGDGVGTLGHLDRMLDQTATCRGRPPSRARKRTCSLPPRTCKTRCARKRWRTTRPTSPTRSRTSRSSSGGPPRTASSAASRRAREHDARRAARRGADAGLCRPARAPSYGVDRGRLTYVALPRAGRGVRDPAELAVARVVVRGDGRAVLAGVTWTRARVARSRGARTHVHCTHARAVGDAARPSVHRRASEGGRRRLPRAVRAVPRRRYAGRRGTRRRRDGVSADGAAQQVDAGRHAHDRVREHAVLEPRFAHAGAVRERDGVPAGVELLPRGRDAVPDGPPRRSRASSSGPRTARSRRNPKLGTCTVR